MLRFVTLLAAGLVLASAAPNPVNIFKIDISPEEAQQYLNSLPYTEPQLVAKTATLPLIRYDDPKFRSAEAGPTLGHYWKNGHEIENVNDYVEEVYDANQFHGQDGLGAFAYGYGTPESSKVENRQHSGDVQGSYVYQSGNDLIKVRYWADSEGFHQEDNLPKVVLEPVQETEEVRQARVAHEKAWQEAAAAAALQPDPQGEYKEHANANVRYNAEYQPSASEHQAVYASAPGSQAQHQSPVPAASNVAPQIQPAPAQQTQESQAREGKAYFASAQSSYQSGQQQQYGKLQQHQQSKDEEAEPTGPPRGFFYSFNYPVSIIVPKNQQQQGAINPGTHLDHDTTGVSAHAQYQG